MAKAKYSKAVFGPGIAKLAFLDKPSEPFEGKGDPKYKTRILLEDTPEIREKINEFHSAIEAEAKKAKVKLKKNYATKFNYPEDEDEDDFIPQDGKDRAKFDEDYRGKIWFESASKYKPGLIDSARQSLPEDVKIYNGDVIKVKVEGNPYDGFGSGISLRLKTVQLVEKNTSFSEGPDTDGFDDIEDGYVADQTGGDEDGDDEDF